MRHWALELAIILGSVAGLLGAMLLVRRAGLRYAWPAELQRKAVHVATGTFALTLPLLFDARWPVVLLVCVTVAVMLVLRLPSVARGGIGATIHSVERRSWGDMLFAVAVGFVFCRSTHNAILYVLPIAVLTLSDTAAALAGSTYGRRLFTVEAGTKSVEGVVVFFLVTWIIAQVTLLLFTDIARINVVALSVLIAAFGALVEADSWSGLDNLFLPVGLHLFLEAHLTRSPAGLVSLTVGFLTLMALIMTIAPRYGLSRHSARAYAIALFLICCYTAPQNAVLPALAVVAHIWTRLRSPSDSLYPDMESIASLASISLVWLAAGELSGATAIGFYNMTFAGVAGALVMLGLAGNPHRVKLAAGLALAAALALLFKLILAFAPEATLWRVSPLMAFVMTLVAATAVTARWPQHFERCRSSRVAALAAVVPGIVFATNFIS